MSQQETNDKFQIHPLAVLTDNIVWIWVLSNDAVVVDPSIAEPVIPWLKDKGLNLLAILQTHHHEDHIGGTEELVKVWPKAKVIAAKADLDRIPFQTISVKDGDKIILNGYELRVFEIPGHTKTHIAFYLNDESNQQSALFCGDTLFSGGCGKLFEGTPANMFDSLKRINSLPPETKIYCGHEYTEANLKWANSLHPKDDYIKHKLKEVVLKRQNGVITLPSTIKEERKINLFIQAQSIDQLSLLRNHKDNWRS